MNPNLYRIVFSRPRGTVVAASFAFAALTRLQAQVVADPSAPGRQQPTVLTTGNGLPLVNIQTPSAAGVSRNAYRRFDVQAPGAVLNNARGSTKTALGGWVPGNPWLAGGGARVIVNEVNSSQPSLLRGTLEVAGSRAQVVIANPAGISCDGCGFIQADRVTLTTGAPLFNGGSLEGLRVRGGAVNVFGAGLDARSADFTEIIARAVQVNAGLWAQALAISAGLGVFDAAGSDSGPAWTGPRGDMSATADGTSPSFAIDVALLGGMYAGKITLVGNESGVGVRNAGHIGASAGEVRLTADGRIENAGSVTGQGVRLQSQAGLANSGVVYAQGAATLATRGELSNSGLIAASGETALSASGAGARVIGLEGSALAAGLSADGELIEAAPGAPAPVGGVLRVSVEGTVALHGQNLASSEMAITGAAVDVAGSQTRAPVIVLSATTGGVDTSRAAIGAGQLLVVSAPGGLLRTDAAALSAPRLDLRALALSNVGGSLSQTGADGLGLRFADALDNSGGRIAASGPISVSTGRLVNAGGELVTDRSLSIDAVDADNRAGTLMAGGDLAVSAATVSNAGGSLVAGHAATLAVGDLNNTDGTVSAAHALTVLADGVRNDRGTLRAGADGEVLVRGTFDNAGGLLTAGGDLRVRANALSNHGTLYAGAQTRVDVAAGLINGGTLAAHGNTTLVARQIDSGAGSVLGAGVEVATTGVGVGPAAGAASSVNPSPSLVVFADRVAAHGRNTAPGLLRVEAGAIDLSGSHTSAGDVVLTASAGDIATRNAQLSAAGSLTLRADGAAGQVFDNTGGAIVADAGVSIRVSRVDNTRGSIETAGAASLDMAASLSNAQGRISVGGDLALRATDVGPSGHLQAGRDLTLSASGDLRSDGVLMAGRDVALAANGTVTNQGTVLAQRDVAITSASLNNDGAIQAGRDLGLSVFAAVNHGGLRADRDLRLVADRVDSDGTVIAGRDLRLTATSVVSNGGVIAAGADLTAQAGQVVNAGRLQADRHVALDATVVVNSGRIDAAGHVVIRAGGTVDQTGVVTARGDVSVAAAQITADATSVFAAGLAATPATSTASIGPLPDAALSPTERGDLSLSAGRLGAHGQNVAAGAATFTGHSLDLSSSHTSAADIALWIGGEDLGPGGAAAVNTRGAVIAADHRLSLRPADDTASAAAPTTNGLAARPSLDNGGGDLRAGSLDLRLSGLSNVGGSVVQTGGEALTLDVGGEIDNRGGRLASNAVDWTIAAARLIQTDGRIEHAGGGALTVNAGRIEGVRGELRSHGALRLTGGDVVLDAGQIVADRIALTAASLSNREGLISQLSGGALSIAVTGRFDNQDATLAGNADVAITAGELLNQGGSIQAAGANPDGKASRLRIDVAGRVDNQGGTLAAAGAAEVLADRLDNRQGRVTAGDRLVVRTEQALDNRTGLLAGRNHVEASARSLDNTGGGIASVDGGADVIARNAALVNRDGRIEAAQDAKVSGLGLDNRGGVITGRDLAIDSRLQTLSNAGGTVVASGALDVQSGALDNDGGRLQAQGQLGIDTHGQTLLNTGSGSDAGVIGRGDVRLATGDLDNRGGFVGAGRALAVDAASVLNGNGGTITSAGVPPSLGGAPAGIATPTEGMRLTVASLDNRGGQVQALDDLRVEAMGGGVDNSGSLIRSGGHLSITAAQVVNAETLTPATDATGLTMPAALPGQGLEGRSVGIAAERLDNRSGTIRADESVLVTGGGFIDNRLGRITGGSVALRDAAAGGPGAARSKTLSIDNDGGTLQAVTDLEVDAARLSGIGTLQSQGDLSIRLDGDHRQTGVFEAGGNATLMVSGQLVNETTLRAGGVLVVSANSLDNTASGEIAGAQTRIEVAQSLVNRGLIDGGQVWVSASTLGNLGTGRLYGNAVSVQALALRNDVDAAAAGTPTADVAATMAARERLDIAAREFVNREGALVFSAGDLAIGGALDANRRAIGQAQAVVNRSATLEALGALSIASDSIVNGNDHFAYAVPAAAESGSPAVPAAAPVVEHSLVGQTRRYAADEVRLVELKANFYFELLYQTHAASDVAWLGNNDRRQLLLPSDTYPFEKFARYYAGSAATAHSADVAREQCFGESQVCSSFIEPGRHYAATDAIWADFGVDPAAGDVALDVALAAFQQSITDRSVQDWDYWQSTQTVRAPQTTSSAPGRIASGGDMTLAARDIRNDKSRIVAGGDLVVVGGQVNNAGAQAQGEVLRTGSVVHTFMGSCGDCGDDREYLTAPFSEVTPISIDLSIGQTIAHAGASDVAWQGAALPGAPGGAPAIDAAGAAQAEGRQGAAVNAQTRWEGVGTLSLGGWSGAVGTGANGAAAAAGLARAADAASGAGLTSPHWPSSLGSGAALPGMVEVAASLTADAVRLAGIDSLRAVPPVVIRTVTPNAAVPRGSLFRQNPLPQAASLVETDPRFADYRQWLGGDYLLQQLETDPALTPKRLGDGFYEQQLLREQVAQLTGRRFLEGFDSDQAQFQALMDAGVQAARAFDLRPGIALTAEQMAALGTDIVWLVERPVTLADGSVQRLLAPQLYVRLQPGDLSGDGTLLSGGTLHMELSGDVVNSATIAGRRAVTLNAENVANLGGRISAGEVAVAARNDLNNIGGTIDAASRLQATAGRDLNVASTLGSAPAPTGSRTALDRVAGLYVSDAAATLVASAGRDVNLTAAQVVNLGAAGQTLIAAGRDLTLDTLHESSEQTAVWNAASSRHDASAQDAGTRVSVRGGVTLSAGNDAVLKAASVTSAAGAVEVLAGRDVRLEAGQAGLQLDEGHRVKRKGFLSSKTVTTRDELSQAESVATTLSGDTARVQAGRDIVVTGSNVVSSSGTSLAAGNRVTLDVATHPQSQDHFREKTQSGLFGSGLSVTLGDRLQSSDTADRTDVAAGSTVGSTDGSVSISAGGAYRQIGSDVLAPSGDVAIHGASVDIVEAREQAQRREATRFEQSGITVAVSAPVLTALQAVMQMDEASGKSGDSRMQALGAANAAMNAKTAMDSVQVSAAAQGGQGGGQSANVSISITAGSSQSRSTTTQQTDSAQGSTVAAGGNVVIAAVGAGGRSDLTIQGSDISAGGSVRLQADDQVNLRSAGNGSEQHSQNSSQSAGAGLAITYGSNGAAFGFTANASAARGNADGRDVSHTPTHITAGDTATVQSGGDTTLDGAVMRAHRVQADVGGDLRIASQQDTRTFDSQNQSAGGSVTIGYGFSGSASASSAKVRGDHASVAEQSGIQAGDSGFDVHVAGDTRLVGGVIASTDKAVNEGANRFSTGGALTTVDIVNRDSHDASGFSLSGGYGRSDGSKDGVQQFAGGSQGVAAGMGGSKGSQQSVTTAGISGIAGDAAVRSTDSVARLTQRWDGDDLAEEVGAQLRITSEFGQQASRLVGDYAQERLNDAAQKEQQALAAQDPDERERLHGEAQALQAQWSASGTLRVAAHAAIGALTGGAAGAAGVAAGTLTAPAVAHALAEADVDPVLADVLTALASTASGAALGGAAGAQAAVNEVTNNYLTHAEIELLKLATAACVKDPQAPACTEKTRLETLDRRRDEALRPLLDACKKSGKVGDCEAVAQHYAQANGFGFASNKYESAGRTGSPFSFNGTLQGKGDDAHYVPPQIRNKDGTSSPDPGGLSYGPFQLASQAGGFTDFLNYLKNRTPEDGQGFYKELEKAGGLAAARSGELEFVDKFMELSLRDPQFVEYQFESINQGSNMRFVRNQLTSVAVNFEALGSEQKDAVFSTSVQQGGGGADKAVDYAFSPKTYTEVQTDFSLKQQEYQKLKDEGKKLEAERGNLEAQAKVLERQAKVLERQAKELALQQNAILVRQVDSLKRNEEVDSITLDRLKNQSLSIDKKIERIEKEIEIQTAKVKAQSVKVLSNDESARSLETWLLKNAKAGAENPEQFIKDIYEWRIKNRPSEAKSRYIPERDMLLKQLKDKKDKNP